MDWNRAFTSAALIGCLAAAGLGLGKGEAAPPPAKKPATVNLTPAYNAYINRLRNKVNSAWNYPDGKNRVVLTAVINADGSVSDLVLTSTPHNEAAEQAANSAFSQAQPLEQLPAGSPPSARLTLTFDSTSGQHDSSTSLSGRLDPIAPKPQPPAQP